MFIDSIDRLPLIMRTDVRTAHVFKGLMVDQCEKLCSLPTLVVLICDKHFLSVRIRNN
jgi:hypothetical protein